MWGQSILDGGVVDPFKPARSYKDYDTKFGNSA